MNVEYGLDLSQKNVSNFSTVYHKYNRHHFDWSFIEDLQNNVEVVTILRHPVDRAISHDAVF